MPSSPFGLAYGLGAGLANAPQAYTQGQQQGMAMSMQNLQLQEAIRQANENKRINEIMSRPLEEQTVTIPAQEAIPAEYAPDKSGWVGAPMQGTNIDESKIGAMGGAEYVPRNAGADIQTKAAKAATPERTVSKFTTPYEQMAWELGQRADMLRQAGLGRSALQLQEQASQLQLQHQQMSMQKAASAASFGAFEDATKYLQSISPNIASLGKSPDNPSAVRVTQNDGSYTDIDRDKIGAMIKGDFSVLGSMSWHQAQVQQRREASEGRLALGWAGLTQKGEQFLQRMDVTKAGLSIKAQALYGTAFNSTSKLADQMGLTGDEKAKWVAEHMPSERKIELQAANDELRGITAQKNAMIKGNFGKVPTSGPTKAAYDELEKQEALARSKVQAAGGSPVSQRQATAPKQQPAQGGKKGFTVKGGKVVASTNPNFKVGMDAKNSAGATVPDGDY